mmetsp:Transcript_950/g.1320  ORF Transcript_950/g.1320 Transcript_950/m.1320 type:complete len:201 (+) Transcript_950:1072-1674(+)
MHQDVSFYADRVVVLRLLHLRTYFSHCLADFFLFSLCFGHISLTEFSAARKCLRKTPSNGVLIERVVEPGVSIVHNILLSKFGRVGIISPDTKWDDANHDNEVCHENKVAVVCVKEPRRKTNTDLKTLLAIRVTILLIIFLGRSISESLVGLGHHHKHSLCRRIVRILVRVILQTHLFVCLLDLLCISARVNTKDGEGIK